MGESSMLRVLAGYDGSLPAAAALGVGAALIQDAQAWIAYAWTPPFASEQMRRRLWHGTAHVNEFVDAVEREGHGEAERIAAMGVALGHAAGWTAQPLVARSYGGEGLQLVQLADEVNADLVLIGSRGLGGAKAVLGSVSDMAVHYARRPVLVVPYPLLTADHAALRDGPVLVGWDASAGAGTALRAAMRLWPNRQFLLTGVDHDPVAPADTAAHVTALRVDSRHEGSSPAVGDALAAAAREHDAAVLVLGSRGRSAVREILLGSVAMSTLHRAHRPVMIVPRPQGPTGPASPRS